MTNHHSDPDGCPSRRDGFIAEYDLFRLAETLRSIYLPPPSPDMQHLLDQIDAADRAS